MLVNFKQFPFLDMQDLRYKKCVHVHVNMIWFGRWVDVVAVFFRVVVCFVAL